MAAPSKALWFSGICDRLQQKIVNWEARYEQGEVSRTRKWLAPDGRVLDIPVQYTHVIPFRPIEFERLVKIMEALRPEKVDLVEMLQINQRCMRSYKLVHTGEYMVPMPYYKQDVQEILGALKEAKSGAAAGWDKIVEEKQAEGKPLWQ